MNRKIVHTEAMRMDGPSIQNLIAVIRGFSNETTMQALANKLDISYSTLNRANKSGKWPRSVAHQDMRALFDECRDLYFNHDGEALAKSALRQLQGQGIGVQSLVQELDRNGYDGFVTELILQAQHYDPDAETPELPEQSTSPEPSQPSPAPEPFEFNLIATIPLAIVLLVGLFNVSLSSMFVWAARFPLAFVVMSLLIAVLPVLTGVFIDAPLAWRNYKHTHPDATFSFKDFARVAKFGDVADTIPGAGRFDLTKSYLIHQPVCNLSGALCYLSLFFSLIALPGFYDFFIGHAWIEFFKIGIAVAFFAAFGHMQDQLRTSAPQNDPDALLEGFNLQNPDNHLPSRVHVWTNALHLVWTISLLIVLALSLIAYGVATFRTQTLSPILLLPYA